MKTLDRATILLAAVIIGLGAAARPILDYIHWYLDLAP